MKTLRLVSLAMCFGAGAVLVASGQGPAAAQAEKKASQQWEYESVNGENVGAFNQLGAQGWELCASASATPTHAASFIFKRPKVAAPQAAVAPPGSKVWGTWEHTFEDAPELRQVKIINRTHFVWVTYNRQDGTPRSVGGGTYTIDEESYKEKFEFGGADLVGKEQTFTAKFEEDKWQHSGKLSNGVDINEVWRKVK
jgi:hypothetical protein